MLEEFYLQTPSLLQDPCRAGVPLYFDTQRGRRAILKLQIEDPLGGKKSIILSQKAIWLAFRYL